MKNLPEIGKLYIANNALSDIVKYSHDIILCVKVIRKKSFPGGYFLVSDGRIFFFTISEIEELTFGSSRDSHVF